MSKIFIAVLGSILVCSCTSVKQIGDLNMVSTRNIESNRNYVLLKTYMGEGNREKRKSDYETIEDAVNGTVKNTPGGEYLMNVKLYKTGKGKFAAEGDVWGIADNITFKGWKVGDIVQWSSGGIKHNGKIVDLKDAKKASVKEGESGEIVNVSYSKLSRSN